MKRLMTDGSHLTCHTTFLPIYTSWLIIIHILCLHVSFFLRLFDVFAHSSHTQYVLELPIKYYYHYLPNHFTHRIVAVKDHNIEFVACLPFSFRFLILRIANNSISYRYLQASLFKSKIIINSALNHTHTHDVWLMANGRIRKFCGFPYHFAIIITMETWKHLLISVEMLVC